MSKTRWRLPGWTGCGEPFLYWTSAVDSVGIDQLLGKDISKGCGFILNQETDELCCRRLAVRRQPLYELEAGHYAMSLLPPKLRGDLQEDPNLAGLVLETLGHGK